MARKDIEEYDEDAVEEREEVDPTATTLQATDPNGDPLTIALTEQQVRENMMEAGYVDGEPPEEVDNDLVDEDDVDETV